jgi:SOS response regulatory protein OraA/RecX
MELKTKGVAQDIIEQAISNFQFSIVNEEESRGVNDLETAKKLVEKKIARYMHLPKQELYQKLGGFLGRKGFDWETIKRAIDTELKKVD